MAATPKPTYDMDWWKKNATPVDSLPIGPDAVRVTDKATGNHYLLDEKTAGQMDPDAYTFEYVGKSGEPTQIMELTPAQKLTRFKRFGQAAVGVGSVFIPGINAASGPLWAQRIAPFASALLRAGIASGAGAGLDVGADVAAGRDPDYQTAQAAATQQFIDGMVGGGIDMSAPRLAEHFMTKALRPNQKMLEDSPTLIKDALQLRTRVRGTGAVPIEARTAGRNAASELRGMINAGQQAGGTLNPQDYMQSLLALRDKIDAEDTTGEAVKALDDFIAEFNSRNGMGLDLQTAQSRKRGAQAKAKAVFKAEKAGADVDVATNIRAQGNRAVARDLRNGINDTLESMGIRSINGRTANQVNESIRKASAVADATRRAQNIQPSRLENLMGGMAGGSVGYLATGDGPMGALMTGTGLVAGQMINNPQMYSNYALLLSDPRFVSLMRAMPAPVANAAYDYTGSDRQPPPFPWQK